MCNSKKNKWFFLFVLFFAMTACQSRQFFDPHTLRISLAAEPDILNPILASDAYASLILGRVNDDLIDINPDTLQVEPKIALRWEVSPNHLEYTFYLRRDVKWHDGQPFTADDVLYSFAKIKDPAVEAPFLRVYYADITEVKKIDDYTVKFVYAKPYFRALIMCGGIPLLPKHIFDDGSDFSQNKNNRLPIGTGPYRFVEWRTNKQIDLVRYEDYWGKKPDIRKIEFNIIADDTVVLQVLKKGEVDQASLRPIQWVRQTGSKKFAHHFNRFKYLIPGYNYIGWNNESPFFADKRVRQAMTHLVDRQKLLEKIQFGLGVIVTGPFFVESPQYNRNLQPYPYDPQKAIALLTEAGWTDSDHDGLLDKDGHPFAFTFLYPASTTFTERLATILKEDLKKVGIEMKIERMEWAAFINRIEKNDFEATSLGWSTGFEGDPYQVWHSSQAEIERGSNFVGFKNREADQLMEKARIEFDETQRNKYYHRLQEIIYDEQPYTFLYSNYSLVVVSKRFTNVKVHKAGLDILEWKVTSDLVDEP